MHQIIHSGLHFQLGCRRGCISRVAVGAVIWLWSPWAGVSSTATTAGVFSVSLEEDIPSPVSRGSVVALPFVVEDMLSVLVAVGGFTACLTLSYMLKRTWVSVLPMGILNVHWLDTEPSLSLLRDTGGHDGDSFLPSCRTRWFRSLKLQVQGI